ncbi:MAG: 5-amino-6-(D-ribitylamino)uracil--L-tyrosine 4-hydroxyphenyl transferase CofH [Halobacteriota archaeon]|nr:5-amino-6-(D-ribitylamino)uracil--L-tyrosine 4-hydroxyphenyl transferase CofH [Halobacteriota archaeon]
MISSDVLERVHKGTVEREDASQLFQADSKELFSLANELREGVNGDIVTYVVNRNINFTNSCVGDCKFCAFRRDEGYILDKDEILEKVGEAYNLGATEVCIQGGLLPNAGVHYYCEMLEEIKSSYDVHIHAYSPMEVFHASRNSDLEVCEVLKELKRSGLDSMPGTAAEILVDRVRGIICPSKLTTDQWINVVKTAHKLGIPTTATMMYGHVETKEERIEHLLKIRDIQRETRGFTEFVPLPFLSRNTHLEGNRLTCLDNLRILALARIIFHRNIKNIQVSWVKMGKTLAGFALLCGANDLGGTLMEENISRSAGSMYGEYIKPEEFDAMISRVGRTPMKRSTLYDRLF